MKYRLGKTSGINFVDSTTLNACDSHRIHSNCVFSEIAKRGKSSTGWFYGFKLHLAVNDRGKILSFCLTTGNVDDRNWVVFDRLTRHMYGKLFADKGYLSPNLFEKLWDRGIQLVTKVKKNMKNRLMDFTDKLLLRKRAIIESVNDFLKNVCQIEHSRYQSVSGFFVKVISGLAAYSFCPISLLSASLGKTLLFFRLDFRRTHVNLFMRIYTVCDLYLAFRKRLWYNKINQNGKGK